MQHAQLVRDEQHREPTLPVEPRDDVHDRRGRPRVHAGGRLVEDEKKRRGGQRTGNQHPLLLAARERGEPLLRDRLHADAARGTRMRAAARYGRPAAAEEFAHTSP